MSKKTLCFGLLVPALSLAMAVQARADAFLTNPGFTTTTLAAGDDNSSGATSLGFTANFFGLTETAAYINNNGNLTFTGPQSTYVPYPLLTTNIPIIAPFFDDVYTVNNAGTVTYGTSTVNGHAAFGVNWNAVGPWYTYTAADTFQLVLIDRSDIAAGDFDIEFNYSSIAWEASQDTSYARVGYSNGSGTAAFELPGSGVPDLFLNGGADALNANSLNSNVAGRYIFNARDGTVTTPATVPDTRTTWALLLGSFGLLEGVRRLSQTRPA